MLQSIPATRQVLQDSVMGDLKGWLLGIREKSREIGEIAFHQTEVKREEWRKISETDAILSSATFNSALERVYNEQDDCYCPAGRC
jgi:exocyst complex component 6